MTKLLITLAKRPGKKQLMKKIWKKLVSKSLGKIKRAKLPDKFPTTRIGSKIQTMLVQIFVTIILIFTAKFFVSILGQRLYIQEVIEHATNYFLNNALYSICLMGSKEIIKRFQGCNEKDLVTMPHSTESQCFVMSVFRPDLLYSSLLMHLSWLQIVLRLGLILLSSKARKHNTAELSLAYRSVTENSSKILLTSIFLPIKVL